MYNRPSVQRTHLSVWSSTQTGQECTRKLTSVPNRLAREIGALTIRPHHCNAKSGCKAASLANAFLLDLSPVQTPRGLRGHSTQDLWAPEGYLENSFCSTFQWSNHFPILHMPCQHSWHGMCKIVMWLDHNFVQKTMFIFFRDLEHGLINH